jgi:UDP-N-acetyl-D-galactosamine dehydrogenase
MKIGIVGLGYVGLPLAIALSKFYNVIGYDIDIDRVNNLHLGRDINQQHFKKEILKKKLKFTSNLSSLRCANVHIITVPTPIKSDYNPDLKLLRNASISVGKILKKNDIVVFESTTYPGCTEEICIPLLEKYSKLKFQNDFNVAYSPERINPGDRINTLKNITKIVGANDLTTSQFVKKIYEKICRSIHVVNSIKIAETSKVIENIQRDLNIALVNELSLLLNQLKIPTKDVLKAASTKWNFHHYSPGLVGGHCISVDPYYLAFKAKKINFNPKLILSGRKINESMGNHVAKQTINLLKKKNVCLQKADVAILGFAFKDNIPDSRNTKVFQIVSELKKKNIKFKVFDSLVSKSYVKNEYKIDISDFKDIKLYKFDAIILAVSHNEFKKKIEYYNKFYKNNKKKIFIDVKNNYSSKDLIENSFDYFQL